MSDAAATTTGNTAYPRPDAEGLERLRALAEAHHELCVQAQRSGLQVVLRTLLGDPLVPRVRPAVIRDEEGSRVFLAGGASSYEEVNFGPAYLLSDADSEASALRIAAAWRRLWMWERVHRAAFAPALLLVIVVSAGALPALVATVAVYIFGILGADALMTRSLVRKHRALLDTLEQIEL